MHETLRVTRVKISQLTAVHPEIIRKLTEKWRISNLVMFT